MKHIFQSHIILFSWILDHELRNNWDKSKSRFCLRKCEFTRKYWLSPHSGRNLCNHPRTIIGSEVASTFPGWQTPPHSELFLAISTECDKDFVETRNGIRRRWWWRGRRSVGEEARKSLPNRHWTVFQSVSHWTVFQRKPRRLHKGVTFPPGSDGYSPSLLNRRSQDTDHIDDDHGKDEPQLSKDAKWTAQLQ